MKQILILLAILFIAGCEEVQLEENTQTTELIPHFSLSTGKDLYHSNEMMNISFDINSEMKENITVRVYGIHASRNRLDMSKEVELVPGENTVEFDYMTPSCTGCAGIKPGTYKINAEFSKDGEVLGSMSKDIEIRQ